jgi:hypothetical protein
VVYESTFYGPTPTPGPAPAELSRPHALPATEILTGGHELQEAPASTTATGLRRPVTLTRRSGRAAPATAPQEPQRHALEALAAPAPVYEPLRTTQIHNDSNLSSAAGAPAADGPKRHSVQHVLRRMRLMFAVVVVGICSLICVANLNMDEPLTFAQMCEALEAAGPLQKVQQGMQALLAWRPVDHWLFGHELREEPTAYAKHLAKKQAGAQGQDGSQSGQVSPGKAAAPTDGSEPQADAPMGYVTITVAKNVQALVRIDDGEASWAPLVTQPIAMGHHVVHAERHRGNGRQEVREVEFDVGPAHVQQSPLTLTLTF